MTKTSARATVRATPSPRERAARTPTTVDRIAFLGSAHASGPHGALYAQAMCWPAIPNAWPALVQAWQAVHVLRDEVRGASATITPGSWIRACAPQLSAPFRDTTAEDSSIAALILRAPIHVAVSVVAFEQNAPAPDALVERQAFARNLSAYGEFLRGPGRRACATLVCRSESVGAEKLCREELAARRSIADAEWLREFEFHAWKEPVEPLPLELACVIAAAVVRDPGQGDAPQPILDAAMTKLVHDAPVDRKRNRGRRR